MSANETMGFLGGPNFDTLDKRLTIPGKLSLLASGGSKITSFSDPSAVLKAEIRDSGDTDLFRDFERERSDVASVARFGQRVECASYYLFVAFDKAHVGDFELVTDFAIIEPKRGVGLWYDNLANTTFNRWYNLRRALLHEWTQPVEVEPLTSRAFDMLSEMTPAGSQLRSLFVHDRPRAFRELTHQLDFHVDQIKSAILLANELEAITSHDVIAEEKMRLDSAQADLLSKAGKPLSLTEAAEQLEVTRQALHKRIGRGSALGLMRGTELVVPDIQFVTLDGSVRIVDGLANVVRIFDESGAGRWSALQFLINIDPNLGRPPIDALKAGNGDIVIHAARAFLSLDEE